jgi:NAD+ synthase (glutamine-hydrolysing)
MVGGQDELVFDGGSFVMDADGEIAFRAKPFKEELPRVVMKATASGVVPEPGDVEPPMSRPALGITSRKTASRASFSACPEASIRR